MNDRFQILNANESAIYQIKVQGQLDKSWSEWFDGMSIGQLNANRPVTTLTGTVRDQAALHGILQKICYLNLPLISVIRIDRGSDEGS